MKTSHLLSFLLKKPGGFLFPQICIVCKEHTSGEKLGSWLCEACLARLVKNHDDRDACPYCSQNRRIKVCLCESSWTPAAERCFSIFDFDDTLKPVIHEFKYAGFKRLAYDMGYTYGALVPPDFFCDVDIVTTVPLHFLRYVKRGYNQADHFALGVLAGCESEIPFIRNILRRTRATKTQTTLTREARMKNMAGVFGVNRKKQSLIKGKSIVLADDVVTTGATTLTCAAALMEYGAKNVRVLSLARD
jgi:ComF family protein